MTLFSISEVKRILGDIGRTKIYELVDSGELTRVHIGTRAVITGASIAAYIERLSAQNAADVITTSDSVGDVQHNAQVDVSGTDPAVA